MRRFLVFAIVILTACEAIAPPKPLHPEDTHPLLPLDPCCVRMEHYPPWIAELARTTSPVLGPMLGAVRARPGTLDGKPEAQARLMAMARPLDLLLTSNKNRASGRIIPGRFTHVTVYLGDEAHLRRIGLWNDPLLRPHHAAIRAGQWFIESEFDGTNLLPRGEVFDTDLVALLRPQGLTPAREHAATRRLLARLGSRFNFRFDLSDCSCTFCTQLVDYAMPWLDLPRRRLYGTETILPDDIAAQALNRDRLQVVGYLRGVTGGWQFGTAGAIQVDMARYWQRHKAGGRAPETCPDAPALPATCSGPNLPSAEPSG